MAAVSIPEDFFKKGPILAPMSGVTNVAFRALCKKYGAGLTYTEFVSSAAIVRGNTRTEQSIRVDPQEDCVGVQLFGSKIEEVVAAAKMLEGSFDIIDVNCGCPAWKVIKTGAGSELLKSPSKIQQFVETLANSCNKPVTVKIRTGIDFKNINAVKVAEIVEKAGAAAITIHGRTQKQGYSGVADWSIIKAVKEAVSIPVIGNGDVDSPEKYKELLEKTGVDGIMIGRAAMSNPYIFAQIAEYMKTGAYSKANKGKIIDDFLFFSKKYDLGIKQIRQHVMHFTKGIPGGATIRQDLKDATLEDMLKIAKNLQ